MSIRARQPLHSLSPGQRHAIREAMRTLVDEDLERGVNPRSEMGCPACGERRSIAGAVAYEGVQLCNECATAYELRRAEGDVESLGEFIGVNG